MTTEATAPRCRFFENERNIIMNLEETRTGGREIFNGRIITVLEDEVLLPDGSSAKREVVRHPGGVCIAPLTETGKLIFVRQYRYPYGEILLELPAGKLEKGEDPLPAAHRELEEETGFRGELIPAGEMYPTPGYCDEIIRLYIAENLTAGEMHPDLDEFIENVRIPLETAAQMALEGQIKDGKTVILILKIAELKRRDLL